MKYTFLLREAGREREKLVLESRAGESDRHIALKVLSYLLFRGDNDLPLCIERGVGQRHKPDLVVTDPDSENILLWVDCGQIETKRLGRISATNPTTDIYVVKATAGEALLYAKAARRFLSDSARESGRVRFIGFSDRFITEILTAMRGTNDVEYRRQNDALWLCWNGAVVSGLLTQVTKGGSGATGRD